MAANDNKRLYDYHPDAQPEDDQTITVAHVDDPYDVYGGRARRECGHMGGTQPPRRGWLGNPYRVAEYGREDAIDEFEDAFARELRDERAFCNAVLGLCGQVVACHCRHLTDDEPACHLDVVREWLLDGRVFRIAHDIHGIPLSGWQTERMADREVLL